MVRRIIFFLFFLPAVKLRDVQGLPHRVQGQAEVVPRGLARFSLVVQHHEHIGDGLGHRRELPRRILVEPIKGSSRPMSRFAS